VYYLAILTENASRIEILFPGDHFLKGFNYSGARANRYINFDPTKRQPIKTPDGSIGVRFTLGPDALKKLRGS
jgi:hypothetical protein